MNLRQMIDAATTKIGGDQQDVAAIVGVSPKYLSDAKSGRHGLPNIACGKLGEILGIDRWTVVAASDLVTEKNPERRAYLAPFVQEIRDTADKARISIL